ncbi:MAG: HAD hydrolase-like protein [Candidatus Paceibacterota bacterium]
MIKNIIFDWSGVIKDCVLDYLTISNKIFKHFGAKEISLKELREEYCQPFMLYYNKYLPDITFEQQADVYRKAISEIPEVKQYKGISDLIKEFKNQGKNLVVISSDNPETLLQEMKSFGLDGVFNEVIFRAYDKEETTRRVIEDNNFKLDETIFIGDSNHEIEVGKKVGIKTGAVTWGFCTKERLEALEPDFLINSLEELRDIVLMS